MLVEPGYYSLREHPQRARSGEDKERRRGVILDAARGLVDELEYPQITVAKLADAAQLGKATLYGYFQTREELLLGVYEDELIRLADAVCAGLVDTREIEDVIDVMVSSLRECRVYRRLVAVVHTHLWPKVSAERALRSRDLFAEQITRAGAAVERSLPFVPAGAGFKVWLRFHAYGLGMLTVSHSNDGRHEPIELFDFDFEADMAALLRALLRSYQAEV